MSPEEGSHVDVPMQDYVEALVEPVADRIRKGDVTLREHIERALAAADELERARIAAVERTLNERWERAQVEMQQIIATAEEAVAQLRRERELVTNAQMAAVAKSEENVGLALSKAEQNTDRRFEQAAQERADLRERIAHLAPREVVQSQIDDLRRAVAEMTTKLSKIA